jgi:hypothetical protein
MITAFVGMTPSRLNRSNARLRLERAVVPAANDETLPRLLVGAVSNSVVSATE